MALEHDSSDFVDRDFRPSAPSPPSASSPFAAAPREATSRPATREELDARVTATHQKLAELKQAQLQLERERSALEEARRRQAEFQTGREEMVRHLTRGAGLLQEAEFVARRDAEQMNKTLANLREAVAKVQAIRDETWTKEDYEVELTRALTTIENARMEWNTARLKWPLLDAATRPQDESSSSNKPSPLAPLLAGHSWVELGKLGLALTWPLALAALLATVAFLVLYRR